MQEIYVKPEAQKKRWVAYFDILGFTALIETRSWENVFTPYSKVVEVARHVIARENRAKIVTQVCFSDTILCYTRDDSFESFYSINDASKKLIDSYISDRMPVRGAMACEEFYVDENNGLHFGKALIESYKYTKNQDWIGFILTPSAVNQLRCCKWDVPTSKGYVDHYAYWDVPHHNKTKKESNLFDAKLLAYLIGDPTIPGGTNDCLRELEAMKNQAECSHIEQKYERTIEFISKNRTT